MSKYPESRIKLRSLPAPYNETQARPWQYEFLGLGFRVWGCARTKGALRAKPCVISPDGPLLLANPMHL